MLDDLKAQIVLTAQRAQREGLCKHRSGNVSAYDRESGYLLVTPSGIDREKLQPCDICVLDRDLHQIEGGKPSSETLMHAACYRMRDDIGALVHTHSRFATAFAITGKPIPAIVYEMFIFKLDNAAIPVAPFATPGTTELADNVAKAIRTSDLVLMERHGTIAAGKDPESALLGAFYIEEFAELYYRALVIGAGNEPPAFTQKELEVWKYPDKLVK